MKEEGGKTIISCRLTGKRGAGIKAHIIPRSLFPLGAGPCSVFFVGEEFAKKERSPVGIYDPSILTEEGERYFAGCDDFAAKFFLNRGGYNAKKKAGVISHRGEPFWIEIEEPEVNRLKFFLLSVLWRASVSGNKFFKNVVLPSGVESRIRNLILRGSTGQKREFDIILLRHFDAPEDGVPIRPPHATVINGVNFYKLTLPQMTALIRVDRKPLPRWLRYLVIGRTPLLRVQVIGSYKDAEDYRLLVKHHASGGAFNRKAL